MSLRAVAGVPVRGSFDPGAVLRHLRDISVLELTETGDVNCRVSSASQASRLPEAALSGLRTLGLGRLLDQRAPVYGRRKAGHGTHHWLRLPLLSDCGSRLMILCHDEFVLERHQAEGKSRGVRRFSLSGIPIAA